MSIFSYSFAHTVQWLRSLVVLGLVCLILGWTLPATAANRISPRLEENILRVIREHPEVVLESLQAYQQQEQQKVQQVRQVFLQDLKTNPQAIIGDSPTMGSTSAKTILVEFSDFECPYCAEAHNTLKQLMAKNPDKFTLVYKNFPLTSIHAQAIPAAQAAWAAYKQGKFWEYQDALFAHQKHLGEELYLETAKNLNLDLDKFEQDRQSAQTAIGKDIQLALNLKLSGTPFFIINSETYSGAVQLTDIDKVLAQKA